MIAVSGNQGDHLRTMIRNYVLLHFFVEPVTIDSIYLLFQNIEGR